MDSKVKPPTINYITWPKPAPKQVGLTQTRVGFQPVPTPSCTYMIHVRVSYGLVKYFSSASTSYPHLDPIFIRSDLHRSH